MSLPLTLCTPRSVHTLTLHLLSRACCCDGGYMLMFTLATCTCYKACLHTLKQPNTHTYTKTSFCPQSLISMAPRCVCRGV